MDGGIRKARHTHASHGCSWRHPFVLTHPLPRARPHSCTNTQSIGIAAQQEDRRPRLRGTCSHTDARRHNHAWTREDGAVPRTQAVFIRTMTGDLALESGTGSALPPASEPRPPWLFSAAPRLRMPVCPTRETTGRQVREPQGAERGTKVVGMGQALYCISRVLQGYTSASDASRAACPEHLPPHAAAHIKPKIGFPPFRDPTKEDAPWLRKGAVKQTCHW